MSAGRRLRSRSIAVTFGLFAAVALTGCASPKKKANDVRETFERAFPEAQFAVSCSDDLGPDSSTEYRCDVIWGARDQKLGVRETYEWQKRFQRYDFRDSELQYGLTAGIISDGRIVPLRIDCGDVTEGDREYPSFTYILAYPESLGPPGANVASNVDRQVRNFARHGCAFVLTVRAGG